MLFFFLRLSSALLLREILYGCGAFRGDRESKDRDNYSVCIEKTGEVDSLLKHPPVPDINFFRRRLLLCLNETSDDARGTHRTHHTPLQLAHELLLRTSEQEASTGPRDRVV